MLMGIIIINNKFRCRPARRVSNLFCNNDLRRLTAPVPQPGLSTKKKSLHTIMIMIIICIAQIASSLGRMTLPFCEQNRESLIGALAAKGLPAKRGGSLLAPPVRRQTPDWLGLFPRMTLTWMNSTVFATPSSQPLLLPLPSSS